MISGKLVHLIESHGDEIITRVVDQLRREPDLAHVRKLLEPELHTWRQDLLHNLGHWLSGGNEEDLAQQYEKAGVFRYEEGIPLHECVRALCLVRENIVDYVEEHIVSKSSMELYAEEELERRLGRFFDLLIIHLVRGYERALRRTAAAATA